MEVKREGIRRILRFVLVFALASLILGYFSSGATLDKRHIRNGLFVASAICLGFAAYGMLKGTVSAPRGAGRSLSTYQVSRSDEPFVFWINVGLYIAAGAGLLYWGFTFAA